VEVALAFVLGTVAGLLLAALFAHLRRRDGAG
jgi:ABC-type nitrate/sulfonate/bicarbonate transport system permease component